MFHLQVGPPALVVRTVGAYAGMIVGFRVFGKREIGQVTVFDVAMVLLIANAVQNAMVGPDTSLIGGLIVAGTLLVLNYAVARLRIRDKLFRHWVEGKPSILISHGHWNEAVLRREGLDRGEVEAAMRENGVLDAHAVRLAVLEDNGSISVVPGETKTVPLHRHGGAHARGAAEGEPRAQEPADPGGRGGHVRGDPRGVVPGLRADPPAVAARRVVGGIGAAGPSEPGAPTRAESAAHTERGGAHR
jgi:uncharacterized membrane protein YcaP (DUF421 family)